MCVTGAGHDDVVVEDVVRSAADDRSNLFLDVRLRNTTDVTRHFRSLVTVWMYWRGVQSSVGYGDILTAARTYVVDLPLDVDSWGQADGPRRETTPLVPPVVLPGDEDIEMNIQMHYSFVGRIDWHPQSDWDIRFKLLLVDDTDRQVALLPFTSWRRFPSGQDLWVR
jgi:hypothetical protein